MCVMAGHVVFGTGVTVAGYLGCNGACSCSTPLTGLHQQTNCRLRLQKQDAHLNRSSTFYGAKQLLPAGQCCARS